MCHELAQATSDPEGSAMDELVKDADRLVSCLANKATALCCFFFVTNILNTVKKLVLGNLRVFFFLNR